jgi:hypothetical protein
MPRHAFVAASLSLALAAWLAPVARAEWEDPKHSRTEMALTEETLPKGWALLSEEKAPKALEEAVVAAAKESGLPRAEFEILLQAVKSPADVVAGLALIDVYVDPAKFLTALKARAEKDGLLVKEMASPARLLLVSAPADAREEVVAIQVKAAARGIAKRAFQEQRDTEGAEALARTSLALEPGAAMPRLVYAVIAGREAPNDPEMLKKAVAEMRAALSESATPPLDATFRALGQGELAGFLLQVKTPEADVEARDLLKRAVAAPADLTKQGVAAFRYNLACAHARLKELDPAFEELKKALAVDKDTPLAGISDWWRKDPDFENLKADPRWKDVILKEFGEADSTTKE